MISLALKDTEFPENGIREIREIARAVLLNEDGKVAIHVIHRNDIFGNQVYFETPGGGIDPGETPEEAVIREIEEETGCVGEVVVKIGEVTDFYNLIQRENHNHYFIVLKTGEKQKHFASPGDTLIQKTLWVPIEEAIKLYENAPDEKVSKLVKNREIPILREAMRIKNDLIV